MSPTPFVYSARLSDDRDWSFCTLCGDSVLPEFPHHCDDPLAAARGIVLAITASLLVVLVLVGALVAGSAW